MGRFELNSDCHVTALQAQSKLAISPSYEVRFCYISTCWKDNFNIFPMDLIPQSYIFCTCRSSRNNCQVMLSPCLFQVMVESDLGLWLACVPYSLGLMPMYLQIGFYLCLLSRVSPTNSETPSDLIYLADPPRIAWIREQGIEFSWARIVSRRNPLSGSCSNWSTGQRTSICYVD